MLKRMIVLALPIALCVAGLAVANEPSGEQHRGEIMSVDTSAKTITVKITASGNKENHIYKIVDGTTIIRDANQKVIGFGDLKDGQHVQVVSKKKGGDRIAMEVTLKNTKSSKSK